jgi:hypothetical protein
MQKHSEAARCGQPLDGISPPTASPRQATESDMEDVVEAHNPTRRTDIVAIKGLQKRQPWRDFIQLPEVAGEESMGLRNFDETRLFEEADDKRLGG